MMLDAEYNSTNEFGEIIHDASATKWIDLSGNGYDFTKNSGGSWADKHFNFNKLAATGVKVLPWYYTQEIVTSPTGGRFIFVGFVSGGCLVQGAVTVNATTNRFQTSFLRSEGTTVWINAGPAEKTPFTLTSLYSDSLSVGQKESYVSGVGPDTSYTGKNTWTLSSTLPLIGARNTANGNVGIGKLYSIRLYTRELTPDEIARNTEIDDIKLIGSIRNITSELNDHLGIVYTYFVHEENVFIKETDKLIGEWMSVSDLIKHYVKLEDWAKFIVDYAYSKH
jgi:hypothetical protein